MSLFRRVDIRDRRIKHMEETIDKCFKTIESMNADYLKVLGDVFVLRNVEAQLRKEIDTLRSERDHATHSTLSVNRRLGDTGCLFCGAYTDHGGLQCPKIKPTATADLAGTRSGQIGGKQP